MVVESATRSRTLPPEAFTDEAWQAMEWNTVFASSWLMVPEPPAQALRDDPRGMQDLVRLNGARAPFVFADRPYFLQRDREGVLRAFANVCTHAWHALVTGPERDRTLTCPQHGRRFALDGTMQGQPGFPADEAPAPDDHLVARPAASWGPLIFFHRGKPDRTLDATLLPVWHSLGRLDVTRLRRQPTADETREVAGNWKQHAWNYLDASHIPFVHSRPGGLGDAVDLESYVTEIHADAVLQWAYARKAETGFSPDVLPERFRDPQGRRVFALWWFVAPNLTLNVYPWGVSVNQYNPVPGRPDRTLFHWLHYVWDDALYARREAWHLATVDDEDVAAIGQVARGLRSGEAKAGRFSATETGPRWFHNWIRERTRGRSGPGGPT